MGIDHRILGKKRKDGLVARMKLYELRPEGCEDTRKNNPGRPSTKELTNAEKIERLEQKVAYKVYVILAYPDAQILNFDTSPISQTTYEDTSHYQITKGFLENRGRYLRKLFEE